MLAICSRNGLRPPSAAALRKVGSCMVGEQAATTARVMPSSLMSFLMRSWPGSEHMYLYSRATATLGCVAAHSDDLVDVDLAGDVGAAVADVDADLLFSSHRHLLLAAHAGIAASTSSQGTICLSMASFSGFDAEREAGELGEVHDRDLEVGAEGGVDARLVGLEVHLAQRAGRDHDVGALVGRRLEQLVAHAQGGVLLGHHHHAAAALDLGRRSRRRRRPGP